MSDNITLNITQGETATVLAQAGRYVGRETPQGRQWPELDLNGQPYNRSRATVRFLTPALFVVIPQNWRGEVMLAQPAAVPAVEAERPAEAEEATSFRKTRGSNAGS